MFFQLNHHICGQLGGLTGGGNDVFGKVDELVILPYLYLQQPFNLKYTPSPPTVLNWISKRWVDVC